MAPETKKKLFDHFRNSLLEEGLSTKNSDALLCPLCWDETPYKDLSYEHIVPKSVGGKRRIITCKKCNNQHGTELDSHLSQFQNIIDGAKGHGTIRAKISALGYKVDANIKWELGSTKIALVRKASNPKSLSALETEFMAGNVKELNFTIPYGYKMNNFRTALLRAAYLALFKCMAYGYVKHEVIQVIRRRILDTSLKHPRLESLIVQLQNFVMPNGYEYLITQGQIDSIKFFLVTICLRKQTTTCHGIFIPCPGIRSSEFYDIIEQYSHENKKFTCTIRWDSFFS